MGVFCLLFCLLSLLVSVVTVWLFAERHFYWRPLCFKKTKQHPYYAHYKEDREIKCDFRAVQLARVASRWGYSNKSLEHHFKPVSEKRFSLFTLLNLVQSMADDIKNAPAAETCLMKWLRLFDDSFFCSNRLEDHERAFLLGALHFWLRVNDYDDDEFMKYLERTACHKLYLQPYFDAFKNAPIESPQQVELKSTTIIETTFNGPSSGDKQRADRTIIINDTLNQKHHDNEREHS